MLNKVSFSKHKIIYSIVLLIALSSSLINAQWNFQLGTNQEFSSNPFRSVTPYSDFISTFNVGIEREFNDFNILYYGSYNKFAEATDIDYYWHQLGFYKETESLVWGAYFEQRFNQEANNYFNYLNYAAYVRKSFQLLSINWEANASYSSMNYSIIPDFNNWVVSTGLLGRKSFETKTTFIGSVLLNYKGFKNFSADSSYGGEFVNYLSEDVNITQLVFNGRVAQSLAENTGLALNINYKKILSGSGLSASLIESTYGNMELYDDPISQEGYSARGILTQVLPLDYTVKLSYSYADKSYPSQGIYLSETEEDLDISRKDTQTYFSTSISKSIYLDNESGSELDLKLNYYLINNKSNSYYFNYYINTISFSLNYIF
ncbi:MAG: hypothetical protein PF445_00870 [Melioribacteraceae bacterium]|jgi:hypothetical protein|nr:hypothetical protein [Melioribacteraceae bacterium]